MIINKTKNNKDYVFKNDYLEEWKALRKCSII